MAVQKKPRFQKLAIFDIDGTIFRSSLLIEIVDALIHRGIFKPSVAKIYQRHKEEWLDREGSYEEYISAVVKAFCKNMKGVRYQEFLRIANTVAMLHQHRVYRFTRDLVHDLKKKGYYLVSISHSPLAIVSPFAKSLGFDKAYGTLYELDATGKKFTGKVLYQDLILDKVKIVERLLAKEPVTLRGSVGVGDTESDISFLHLVDTPMCFNPNQKLLRAAKRNGWRVVVERKDVVYRISEKR